MDALKQGEIEQIKLQKVMMLDSDSNPLKSVMVKISENLKKLLINKFYYANIQIGNDFDILSSYPIKISLKGIRYTMQFIAYKAI